MSNLRIEAWRINRNRRNRITRRKRGPRIIATKYATIAALQLPRVTIVQLVRALFSKS